MVKRCIRLVKVTRTSKENVGITVTGSAHYYRKFFFIFNVVRAFVSTVEEVIVQTYVDRKRIYTDFFVKIDVRYIYSCCKILAKSLFFSFDQLVALTCVDNLTLDRVDIDKRFSLLYILGKINIPSRVIIIIDFSEDYMVPSITSLYSSANWLEREVFDMFGIFFKDHNDMRRILTDYGFKGFPLRKDFPLTGYLELRYNEERKHVKYKKLVLMQEYRFFNFSSPWGQYEVSKEYI